MNYTKTRILGGDLRILPAAFIYGTAFMFQALQKVCAETDSYPPGVHPLPYAIQRALPRVAVVSNTANPNCGML